MNFYKQQIKTLLKIISYKVDESCGKIYQSFIEQVDELDDITICELYSTLSELNRKDNYKLLEKFSNKLSEYTWFL